jgi:ABC-type multidrug transport system fused ATPase/permease subunit
VAHVPQSIFLSDGSITENIAFGVEPAAVDFEQVQQAARLAKIAEFVESLPAGYDTYVGERGIRLSGGQRQRIGIARALYKRASVIVFDEATSALDNATEREVMAAIEGLSGELTIILIAHRLTTVEKCDCIFELDQGSILITGGTGSFGKTFLPMTLKKYNPKRIVIYSRDEMKQWDMALKFEHDPEYIS